MPDAYLDTLTNMEFPLTVADPAYIGVSFVRDGVGDYRLLVTTNPSTPILVSRISVFFSDGKVRVTGYGNGSPNHSAFFNFSSYLPNGTKSDDVISFTNVHIRVF